MIIQLLFFVLFASPSWSAEERGRVASIYISETFINEQLASHFENSDMIKQLKAEFDPIDNTIFFKRSYATADR